MTSPEQLAALWEAWDARPGNEQVVNALCDACIEYVGVIDSNEFRRFVAARRRDGRTATAAIYAWGPR